MKRKICSEKTHHRPLDKFSRVMELAVAHHRQRHTRKPPVRVTKVDPQPASVRRTEGNLHVGIARIGHLDRNDLAVGLTAAVASGDKTTAQIAIRCFSDRGKQNRQGRECRCAEPPATSSMHSPNEVDGDRVRPRPVGRLQGAHRRYPMPLRYHEMRRLTLGLRITRPSQQEVRDGLVCVRSLVSALPRRSLAPPIAPKTVRIGRFHPNHVKRGTSQISVSQGISGVTSSKRSGSHP